MEPSTQWREVEPPEEAAKVEALVAKLVEAQAKVSEREGAGRALHRKQVLGLSAKLEVLSGLPAHAAQGLFARPGSYEALLRLSNGSLKKQRDTVPDVRGFALEVQGVAGEGALPDSRTEVQDFLFINASRFSFPTGLEFLEFVPAAAKGPLSIVLYMLRRYGFAGFKKLSALQAGVGKPFAGFAAEPLHTTNPLSCGPYAMKLRLTPQRPQPTPAQDLTAEFSGLLAQGPLVYDLHAQYFVSEEHTPIEQADQDWDEAASPFLLVGHLAVPTQDPRSPEGLELQTRVEKERFDPWRALREHRPLGSVMRARKQAYFASARARGAV